MEPPSRALIEEQLNALLDGSRSRDDVDRWACEWVRADSPEVDDPAVWWALRILCGIDLRHGPPPKDFIHTDDQVADWLAEFRQRCADSEHS